jgi:hypothetical protein
MLLLRRMLTVPSLALAGDLIAPMICLPGLQSLVLNLRLAILRYLARETKPE